MVSAKVLVAVGIFSIIFPNASANSTLFFTAVSPKEIFPNSVYNITIAMEPGSSFSSTTFTATISAGETNVSSGTLQVNSGSLGVLGLPVKGLPTTGHGYYNLTLISEDGNGVKFEDNTRIYVDRTEKTIFVQTDKQIYKPGETVHFRIVVLDRFFKPFGTEQSVQVKLLDPERNVIKIWKKGQVINGLFSSKLELSAEPNLGEWKLEAASSSPSATGTLNFLVAQYVLPKFKVDVNLPPFITSNSSDVKAVIQAKYTYGQGLKGTCTVKLSRAGYYYVPRDEKKKVIEKTFPIDGTATINFPGLRDEFKLGASDETVFQVEATVKDEITGQEQTASNQVKLYKLPYKVEYINKPSTYQPGLNLKLTFRVCTQDNIPISDPAPDALRIKHGFSYFEFEAFENSSIPANGIVSFNFITPSNEFISVSSVEVTYKKFKERFWLPGRMTSSSNTFLQLNLFTENPKVNEELELSLMATQEFSSFNYVVYGRGLIVGHGNIQLENPTKEHKFTVIVPPGAAPEGKILIYAIFGSTNEVLADSVTFSVGSILTNNLEISLSDQIREPGQNLTISLKSTKNSTIALRGVDQSVLLLRADKDINMGTIEEKLKELERSRSNRNRLNSGSTAFQVFEKAGLTVITNALLYRHRWEIQARGYAEYDYDEDEEEALGKVKSVRKKARKKTTTTISTEEEGPRIRKNFPETWLWEELSLGETNSTMALTKTVPDTLTSWMITGYSLHSDLGIGVSLQPQVLTTFRPFFLSLNLPYSVVRGEILHLQVLVHNYMEESITAEITLRNDDLEFEFMDGKGTNDPFAVKEVQVGPSQVTSVIFVIKPNKFGSVMLNAKGITTNGNAGDALARPLTVNPPGKQHFENREVLIDLREIAEGGTQNYNLTTDFPAKRVEGADNIKITVIADLLGTTISNLAKLLKMPSGCGEQNMVHFVPDIVILEYLTSAGMLTPAIEAKALKFLESGYQRELTYRHYDGSFSAFGERDSHGSTWLTAFVVRSFVAARPYIEIDENIISKALHFLSKQWRKEEGGFQEKGRVLHSGMQGGSSAGMGLTAYTLLAFIEASNSSSPEYKQLIQDGLNYISNVVDIESGGNAYSTILSAYTLDLADHPKKAQVFNKMKELVTNVGDLMFWDEKRNESLPMEKQVKPISVEMTAYALLTFANQNKVAESLPIGKWLLKQRNAEGGFLSTQDTVVGLTALAKFAKMTRGSTTDVQVKATFPHGSHDIHVDNSNAIVLQEFILPKDSSWVNFEAKGQGTALAQLAWSYYIEDESPKPAFEININAKLTKDGPLKINLCVKYIFVQGGISNMAVVELNLPSGYVFELDDLTNLRVDVPKLKRHDLDNGDTSLLVYFDSIDEPGSCLNVIASKAFKIEKQAPALVMVYDYYDTTKRAEAFYEITMAESEKDCKGENCVED